MTGASDALLVAYPGAVHGQATIALSSQDLWGAEAYLRKNLCCGCCYRVDLLAGYRFLSLREALAANETEISSGEVESVPAGIRFDLNDRFDAYNPFHGGEVGLDAELHHGRAR